MDTNMPHGERHYEPIEESHITESIERQPGAHADRSGHKFRRAVAAVTLLGVGAGIGYAAGHTEDQPSRPEMSHTQEDDAKVSDRVRLDITVATEVDACETKVEAKDVLSIYERVFEPTLPTTFDSLKNKVHETVTEVQANVAKTPLASLNVAQKEFVENANTHQLQGKYKDYKETLSEYLDQFGIKLVDGWQAGTKIGRQMHRSGVDVTTRPLSPQELRNNDSAKAQILNILNGMSKLPKTLIKESGIHTIFLGDSKDNTYDGIAYAAQGTLGFDIHQDVKHQYVNAYTIHNLDVAPHEFMHALDYALCDGFVGSYVNDPGYTSLNRAFKYGEDVRTQLEQGKSIDNHYTSLNNAYPGSEVVVTSPYGATNADEDKATLFGENILFPDRITRLLADDGGNTVVIREKIAYLLARISAKNPDLGRYYVSLFEAAQLAQHVTELARPLEEKMSKYVEQNNDSVDNFTSDPGYKKLLKQAEPYYRLQSQMYSLVGSGGKFSSEESYGMK